MRPAPPPGRIALVALLALRACSAVAAPAEPDRPAPPSLRQGDAVTAGPLTGTLTRLDAPPYVESDYTRRFHFDSFDNPKLKELRERYHLDDVVAPGRTEF